MLSGFSRTAPGSQPAADTGPDAYHSGMTKTLDAMDKPSWDAIMLICKECGKRKNAPDDLKSKVLVKRARGHLKKSRPRPRVISTSCLGVCPKGAIAVAWVGGTHAPRLACVDTPAAFDAALPLLTGSDAR